MQFIDTNIFIRALAKDDLTKYSRCVSLFKKANLGKIELHATETVIAEVVYVLLSKRLYALSREDIVEKLSQILKIKNLKIFRKSIVLSALTIFSQNNIDFEDAVLVANAIYSKSSEIYTYDKEFSKIEGVKRLEP